MRVLAILALTAIGSVWASESAHADRPRLQGNMTYIYPDGTIGYFAGPGGYRSDYYVIPSVSNGRLGPNVNYNSNSYYNGYARPNNFDSSYVDYGWRRPFYRQNSGWNR